MGHAAVQDHRWSTGPHDRAGVAFETLTRRSFGDLADADIARSGGHVMPANGFGRRDLRRAPCAGRRNFGIVSRFELTRYPALAISGGLCGQNIRPAP